MTKEEFNQLNSDLDSVKTYNEYSEIEKADSALYNRLIKKKKNGLLSADDWEGLMSKNKSLPDSSLLLSKKDSLEREAYKPVEIPVEKPVERTAMETLYGTAFPRLYRRTEEGMSPEPGIRVPSKDDLMRTGGDVFAGALDLLSLPPRISNTIAQAPIDTWNKFVGDKPSEQIPFSTIGEIGGGSFQTPNLPSWTPDWIKKAASFVNPVSEGVGEFVTGIGRGPLLPGTFGKPIVGAVLGKMSPGTLKTALEVGGNAGAGAVIGTSESVARGEGVDPFGVVLGGSLGGGFTLIPKYASYLSDKKTGNILLDAQHEKINGALADLNVASRTYTDMLGKNISSEKLQKAKKLVEKYQKKYDEIYEQSTKKWTGKYNEKGKEIKEAVGRQYWESNPAGLSQNYKHSLDKLAAENGYVGKKPTSLIDALEIYSPKRNPTIPMKEIEPAIDNLAEARRLSNQTEAVVGARSAAGKLGALFQLRDILKGESYLPETILRQLPDATSTALIRGGNSLQDYLKSFVMQQDSTRRQ